MASFKATRDSMEISKLDLRVSTPAALLLTHVKYLYTQECLKMCCVLCTKIQGGTNGEG